MRARSVCAALCACAALSGCGARAQREALKDCTFAPRGFSWAESGDSLTVSVKLEVGNPGRVPAVLDSFEAVASGGRPLARLSHGALLRVEPGATATTDVRVRISRQGIVAAAVSLAFAPPDSLRVEGTAWIPGLFGGLSSHAFRTAVPWSRVAPHLRNFAPGAPSGEPSGI